MGIARRLMTAVAAVAVAAGTLAGCDWPEGTRYVDVVFDGYEATTGIPYRTTTTHTGEPITLHLDVYEPAGDTAEQRPVVMWMFGGAWRAGDRNQLASYAQDSARRGYVGVTIDYRIRPEGGDLVGASNDAYEDTLAAIRWLQDHAEELRIDPDPIVPAGYSAGAINALHALHRPADTPAAGAVAIAGMLFHAPSPDRGPSIVFSGTADTVVPHAVSRDQCRQSTDLGSPCRFVAYEGGDHFIALTQAADIRERTADFVFETILWPAGYPVEVMAAAG